jgi:hypothetical protein
MWRCCVGAKPRCSVGSWSVSLLLHTVDCGQPQSCAIWEPTWTVVTYNCLFQSSSPLHLWAPERSRTVDPTSQFFSWGLDKWQASDVACPLEKYARVTSLKERGQRERFTTVQTSRLENPGGLQPNHNRNCNKFLFFSCTVALCTVQNGLQVISNMAWLDSVSHQNEHPPQKSAISSDPKWSQAKSLITSTSLNIVQKAIPIKKRKKEDHSLVRSKLVRFSSRIDWLHVLYAGWVWLQYVWSTSVFSTTPAGAN